MAGFNKTSVPGVDIPDWRPLSTLVTASSSGASIAEDMRNTDDRNPTIFYLASATSLQKINPVGNGNSTTIISPALAGTFGIGTQIRQMESRGPRGVLAAGGTTTTIVLSTALPAAVGTNMLADRGDGKGFKVRIINYVTGKIQERVCIANTAGTTPTIELDSALDSAPNLNDGYEFLSGRVYMLNAGTVVAGLWKYYDILTQSMSGNLATTNLPFSIGTDTAIECMDESHVPWDKIPGEGFVVGASTYDSARLRCLLATGMAAGTITGQAAAGDADVLANEYRNFQIRVVEDTVTPTSVGQRRIIASHTAGPSPVYTLQANWTVTPSANAKFVIENPNYILVHTSASASTYTYAQDAIGSMTADTWNTTQFVALPATIGYGVMSFQSYGISLDTAKNNRYSNVFVFRGGSTVTLYRLDIAGGATGAVFTETYGSMSSVLFTTGASLAYDSVCNDGKYAYIVFGAVPQTYRFNVYTRQLVPWAMFMFAHSTVVGGNKAAIKSMFTTTTSSNLRLTKDPTEKQTSFVQVRCSGTEVFESFITV